MAKFIECANKKFMCDTCKGIFLGKDIILKIASTNFQATSIATPFIFIDKEGVIMGGFNSADGSIGDQILHCPLCNTPHLSGFIPRKE